MQEQLVNWWDMVWPYALRIAAAVGILVAAWIVAAILAAVVRGALKKTQLDDKLSAWLSGESKAKIDIATWLSKTVFYLILLFGLIAFFNALQLPQVSQPLNSLLDEVFAFAPRLFGAAALVLVAFLVATILRFVVTKLLDTLQLDGKLGESAQVASPKASISKSIANTLYWLIFLLFLPMILDALELQGLLEPVQAMLANFLGFLPKLFAAGLILFFGWLVAKIIRQVVTNVLAAAGVDGALEKAGVGTLLGKQNLSGLIGMVLYVFILIPVAISALDTLELGAVSEPAGRMLSTILQALPAIFSAGLILGIAYVVGRFVCNLVSELLSRTGFNNLPNKMGLGWQPEEGQRTPAQMVGYLVLIATLFFASIEAASQLQFDSLAAILVNVVEFSGHVLLGLVIFGIGLWLSNLASSLIESSERKERGLLAMLARVAILVLASAMALREMGMADWIIELAFGLGLFAVALGSALAFGLGGRDTAARTLDDWSKSIKGDSRGD